jgi:hypothetical protein
MVRQVERGIVPLNTDAELIIRLKALEPHADPKEELLFKRRWQPIDEFFELDDVSVISAISTLTCRKVKSKSELSLLS